MGNICNVWNPRMILQLATANEILTIFKSYCKLEALSKPESYSSSSLSASKNEQYKPGREADVSKMKKLLATGIH